MSVKLLYLSYMHPTLEYDDCLMFEELGLDWFSTGVYMLPRERVSYLKMNQQMIDMFHRREPINRDYNAERINHFHRINPTYRSQLFGLNRPHPTVTKEFVEEFDIIYSNQAKFIISNWEQIKHKPIVWRSIGSVESNYERQMKPLIADGNITPVRFSPKENKIPDANEGHYIRNYVDEDIYSGWTGGTPEVLSFQNWAAQRRSFKFGQAYEKIYPKIPARLHGAIAGGNYQLNRGPVSWDEQRRLYRECDVYLYIGSETYVVAYNFLEAMMTGIPVISFGPKIGGIEFDNGSTVFHEPSEFIKNGVNGFVSDNLDELADYAKELIANKELANTISKNGRDTALKYFSKRRAIKEWREFFNSNYGLTLT